MCTFKAITFCINHILLNNTNKTNLIQLKKLWKVVWLLKIYYSKCIKTAINLLNTLMEELLYAFKPLHCV